MMFLLKKNERSSLNQKEQKLVRSAIKMGMEWENGAPFCFMVH